MKLTENLVTFRLKLKNAPGTLGMALTAIGKLGGSMGNIQIIKAEKEFKVRDLAVYVSTDKQVKDIVSALSAIGKELVEVVSVKDKEVLAEITNPDNEKGVIADAMKGKDVFIGVSGPNMITKDMAKTMNKDVAKAVADAAIKNGVATRQLF